MPIATDDSGPAATVISPKLLGLRQACDSMDIKWHWRHKESTLEGLLLEAGDAETVDAALMKQTKTIDQIDTSSHADVREKRSIPQDVLDALAYCNSYHRANTAIIKEYIERIR